MNNKKIDQRLKEIDDEIILLSGYLSDAVEKKLGERISAIKESIDKLRNIGPVGGKVDVEVPEIADGLTRLQSDLDTLIKSIGGSEYKADDDNLTKRLEKSSGVILKSLAALDGQMQDTAQKTAVKQEEIKNSLLKSIDDLRSATEIVKHQISQDEEETLGSLIALIHSRIEELSKDIPVSSERMKQGFTLINEAVRTASRQSDEQHDEGHKLLLKNLERLQENADTLQKQLSQDDEKSLGSRISLMGERIKNISGEIPKTSEKINQGFSSLDKSVQNVSQQLGKQHDEVKEALLKDINNLNDNAEAIRRMCTTDEEKYIGSMTTVIHSTVNEMSETIPNIANNIRKWFQTLDNKVQVTTAEAATSQEEMKKILLFDLNKIGETAEAIRNMCSTVEDRPLGSEMITVSERVEKMSEEVPDIQGKVTALSDKLDRVSSEVIRMRWFVIGAVAISIIVLVASFF